MYVPQHPNTAHIFADHANIFCPAEDTPSRSRLYMFVSFFLLINIRYEEKYLFTLVVAFTGSNTVKKLNISNTEFNLSKLHLVGNY